MRSSTEWRKPLVALLAKHKFGRGAAAFCEVELGLFALENLAPDATAVSLWALLSGYEHPAAQPRHWTAAQRLMLLIVRQLLGGYRSRNSWLRALARYQNGRSGLRGYDVPNPEGRFRRLNPSLVGQRWQIYGRALAETPPYQRSPMTWAEPGDYVFSHRLERYAVSLPESIPAAPPPPLALPAKQVQGPLRIRMDALRETARWMDDKLGQHDGEWAGRMERVRLELFNAERSALLPGEELFLDGSLHLVGMVGAGKSTLMDVVAVALARKGLHVTLVVGDVLSALERADLFVRLGLAAVPILGASNRGRQLAKLHRAVARKQGAALDLKHAGFRWLGTACAIDGLRDAAEPLELKGYPCLSLTPAGAEAGTRHACPLFARCGFHQGQMDLADALIWIATPASLVMTRVAPQLAPERRRMAELIAQRSDLVIFDEADRIQAQLDLLFSPAQTLISRSDDVWLNQVGRHVSQQISSEGRGQLGDANVAAWNHAHDLVQLAASRVYALLLDSAALQTHIRRNYFSAWTLLAELAAILRPGDPNQFAPGDKAKHGLLMDAIRAACDDPLGAHSSHGLVGLIHQGIAAPGSAEYKAGMLAWLGQHAAVPLGGDRLGDLAERFEFALLIAVLADRLQTLIRGWRDIEDRLRLETLGAQLFQGPPPDYGPEVPAAPMGDVLAFQYVSQPNDPDAPGDLRFFRCMGVGRWLMLHFDSRFALSRAQGPHVLLLSATSWAGTAAAFDVQLPVGGVLSAPPAEIAAIEASDFRFEPVANRNGVPIRVSGLQGSQRAQALAALLSGLAKRGGIGGRGVSRLERMRDGLPAGRQRLLLVVGSYAEAAAAREALEQVRPDWRGQIVNMVADDAESEPEWDAASLQRGMVAGFAQTGAWILIAPLLAIERGHNILNEHGKAALGAAYFLIRPHPRPDDLSLPISAINRWAVEAGPQPLLTIAAGDLDGQARAFRAAAHQRWRRLLRLPWIYSSLPAEEHAALTWSQLVTIWQVIGRLVRGGVPATVVFCDAAFMPPAGAGPPAPAERKSSLLLSMIDVLRPYFVAGACSPEEQALARRLYAPLYDALSRLC